MFSCYHCKKTIISKLKVGRKYCHSAEIDQHLKVILRWEVAAAATRTFSGWWELFFPTTSGITGVWKQSLFYSFFPTEVPQRISKETNKRVNDIFQSILKEISPKYPLERLMLKPKLPNTLTPWCEKLTHWKRPWCWERLKVGGEGDDRGWDGWMASLIQRTWVWANSGR